VIDSSTTVASTSPQSDSGGEDDTSQPGTGAADESSGNDSASAGGSTSTADPSGVPPEEPAPDPEPGVDDVIESDVPLVPGCDLEHPLQLQLRTLDAGAAASPAQVRDAALSNWVSLSGIGIRAWEFFNYYTFDYPAAAEPGAIVITPALAQDDNDEYTLQVGIRTHNVPADQRPPLRLTLALDNSGSMQGKAQDLVRITGEAIAASLREGDTVSIVTWNSTEQVVLDTHAVSGPDDKTLLDKLDNFEVGGSADLYSGLVGAYKLAEAAYDPAAWNRVILVSDGGASVNDADLEVIASHPTINLTGVGVGDPGIYRSDLMDAVAHAGRGASLFISSEAEATRQFVDRFIPLLGAAVRDVTVQVQLPPGFELDPRGRRRPRRRRRSHPPQRAHRPRSRVRRAPPPAQLHRLAERRCQARGQGPVRRRADRRAEGDVGRHHPRPAARRGVGRAAQGRRGPRLRAPAGAVAGASGRPRGRPRGRDDADRDGPEVAAQRHRAGGDLRRARGPGRRVI
jgi:Ca-activated chloride channel family protein